MRCGQLSIAEHGFAIVHTDVAGAFKVPGEIGFASGVKGLGGRILVYHAVVLGSRTLPLLDLGMSVREGESAGAVVIGGGNVLPGPGARVIDEEAVVNRVRMFIQNQPCLGRAWHLGLLEVLLILLEAPITALGSGIVANTEPAEDRIHREAAVALDVTLGLLDRAEVVVRGTFVGTDRAAGVPPQHTVEDPGVIGVADIRCPRTCAPRHDVVHPVVKDLSVDGFDGFVDAVVVGDAITAVGCIEKPGQSDLLGVVQTADALGLGLGFAECGQEQSRKDSDDGNDYQQFNKGEGAVASGGAFAATELDAAIRFSDSICRVCLHIALVVVLGRQGSLCLCRLGFPVHEHVYYRGAKRPQRQRESYLPLPIKVGSPVARVPSGAIPG